MRYRLVFLIALLPSGAVAPMALAAEKEDVRLEARERFDRGLRLFEEGDSAGALAEFKRAYMLIPNEVVLLNIGLTYAALQRPVEAVDALERLLGAPGNLQAQHLATARRTLEEQSARIARLDVKTNVAAHIEVDGIGVGKTPFERPLRVAQGSHVVAALATGYLPLRKEVNLAGGTLEAVAFELEPSEKLVANVRVTSPLPGVEVLVDGQTVGMTPLSATVTVAPGRRVFEARRAGYRSERRELELGQGASAELAFALRLDETAPPERFGRLVLEASEGDVEVSIDGEHLGVYRESLRLPAGPHRLRVERAGFEVTERLVDVPQGGGVTVRVSLVPTPETRLAYRRHVSGQRTRALVVLGGGASLAAAGAVLALMAPGKLRDARAEQRAAEAEFARNGGGRCDAATAVPPEVRAECLQRLGEANDRRDLWQGLQTGAWVGVGVGSATTLLGAILLLAADPSDRYDRPSVGATPYALRAPRLGGYVLPGGGGLTLSF